MRHTGKRKSLKFLQLDVMTAVYSSFRGVLCIMGNNFHSNMTALVSSTHCLDLDLNGLLTWRIPGLLGNYTISKWKEFFKSREPIFRKSYLSTFIHINKHMDGARVSFSSCQRNLIKTFQNEAMIALIKKKVLIFSRDLLNGQK